MDKSFLVPGGCHSLASWNARLCGKVGRECQPWGRREFSDCLTAQCTSLPPFQRKELGFVAVGPTTKSHTHWWQISLTLATTWACVTGEDKEWETKGKTHRRVSESQSAGRAVSRQEWKVGWAAGYKRTQWLPAPTGSERFSHWIKHGSVFFLSVYRPLLPFSSPEWSQALICFSFLPGQLTSPITWTTRCSSLTHELRVLVTGVIIRADAIL